MAAEIRILLYICFVIFLFIVHDLKVYLAVFILLFLLSLKLPRKVLKAGWIPITVFVLFTFLSNVLNRHGKILFSAGPFFVTEEGLGVAAVKTLRLLFMIFGVKIMMASSKSEEIIGALGRVMSPLERLGLPVKDFFHTMGLTLQCFPVLKNMAAQTYREETRSADIRGFWDKAKVVSSFLLPLFVRSVQSPELFFGEARDNAK